MSNVAKLKKQAAEFELKKQFDKALAIYIKLLENFDERADELDVALFNRVGDLQLKQGNVADAVDYYERAVDKYTEGGFFNNAIALCNKILRQAPGRASVYYKLGKISAKKGFKSDAKQNFLEYAERMQKAGNVDEAFRALAEFADLCPDQEDIRLMLAEQLVRAGRPDDALEQLQTLYERLEGEGRTAEASATAERIRAIDPSVELRSGGGPRRKAADDLIFIDLDDSPRPSRPAPAPIPPPRESVRAPASAPLEIQTAAREGAVEIERGVELTPPAGIEGVTRLHDDEGTDATDVPSGNLLGLERTQLDDGARPVATPPGGLLDIQPTSLEIEPTVLNIELSSPSDTGSPAPLEPPQSASPDLDFIMPGADPKSASPELDFIMPDAEPPSPPADRQAGAADLGPDLLDLDDASQMPPTAPALPPATQAQSSVDLPLLDLDQTPAAGTSAVNGLPMADLAFNPPTPASITPPRGRPARDLVDDEALITPGTPPRPSTLVAAHSVDILKAAVEGEPNDWSLRRELAEAMFEAGDRAGGMEQLEVAMAGAEAANDLALASSLAEELARLEPEGVRHHQKRVEFAFRRNDRPRLIEAYVALADALLRSEQPEKARTVYQRVLELAPDDLRAQAAVDAIPAPEPEPPPPPRASARTSTGRQATPRASKPMATTEAGGGGDETFVNLGDWLREEEAPKDTRMVVEEQEPTGDEEGDFADMLQKFKRGVAENVDAEDYQSHYDLAIAYKEMGLIDEAIQAFQKALGGLANRLPTYEALGECFLEKNQPRMAANILQRALNESGATEEQLVGVLYLMGRAAELLDQPGQAFDYYQRVFVQDIQFKDVAERIAAVERASR